MTARAQRHGDHTFTVETVYRALAHHEQAGTVEHVSPPGPGQPKFRIVLRGGYDVGALEYTVREAYMLNLGLTTAERVAAKEVTT